MRNVIYKPTDSEDRVPGLFHQWSMQHGNPVAIIETPDGNVQLAYADEVQFVIPTKIDNNAE